MHSHRRRAASFSSLLNASKLAGKRSNHGAWLLSDCVSVRYPIPVRNGKVTRGAKGKTTCAVGVDLAEEGHDFVWVCHARISAPFSVFTVHFTLHFSVEFLAGSLKALKGSPKAQRHITAAPITGAMRLHLLCSFHQGFLPLPAVALDSFSPPSCHSSLVQLLPKSIQRIPQKTWNPLWSSVDSGLNATALLETNLNPSLLDYPLPLSVASRKLILAFSKEIGMPPLSTW